MAEPESPNVLVVFTDQQRWDTLGCYGNPMDLTPNLDAMAERGTLVEQAFTPQPLCAPARACLQTGQFASAHGTWANYDVPRMDTTLAECFNRVDYRTGYVGKWHIGTDDSSETGRVPPENRGGYEDYWRASQTIEHTSHPYEGVVYDGDGHPVEFDGYRVDALTDMAIDFLREERRDPFFLFLSYPEPHHQNDMNAFVAPDGYAERYSNPYVPPDLRGQPGDWFESLPDYYGMCARIDECVGRLRGELERQGIADETVVLFTADHGCTFRTRPGTYKRSPHEASIRIPAVIDGPGFEGGNTFDDLVSLLDVPPTLLDVAGLDVPDEMAGRSLVNLVEGSDGDWRESVFVQMSDGSRSSRALRTDRWKYAVTSPAAGGEGFVRSEYAEWYLYDLHADPWEQTNLIGRRENRAVADQLLVWLRERIDAIEGIEPAIEEPINPS